MPSTRQLATIISCTLLGIALLAAPAGAEPAPATLAVDGTLRVVVVDSFGSGGDADLRYSVETAEGERILVDVPGEPVPNSRFRGELLLDGRLGAALDRRGIGPDDGEQIAGASRVGKQAAAVAADQAVPVEVRNVRLTAPRVAAAADDPAAHRAYVAVVSNRGSVDELDTQIDDAVDGMLQYWVTKSSGVITSFTRPAATRRYASTAAGSTATNCGLQTNPEAVWSEAALQFPGVSFARSSRNHLVVALADECSNGAAGVAELGTGFDSGGRMSITLGSITAQVGVHELGHVFGLDHANASRCSTSTSCTTDEYFDLYSPMALAVDTSTALDAPALDSAFRRRLAVASSSEVPTLTNAGGATQMVSLAPRGASSGVRGVELVDPASSTRYYLDYRSGTGRDQNAFYSTGYSLTGTPYRYPAGVTVTTIDSASRLQLTTQKSGSAYLGSFRAGQAFTAPGGRLSARVASLGGEASVEVGFGAGFAPDSVAVSGTARVGRSVTASGAGWPSGTTVTYQWLRNGSAIAGATSRVYAIPAALKGAALQVRVTGARAGQGQDAALSAARTVASGTFVTAKPRITGTAKVGKRLRVKVGSWSPKPAYSYRWYANGKKIPGGTKTSYKIAKKYQGKRITITVSGRKNGYTTVTRTSSKTTKVKKK